MVPLGISGAAATRVGNAIGRGDLPGARRSAAASLLLGAAPMSASPSCSPPSPVPLGRLYTRDPAVIAVVAALLPIAAVFQVFDGLQVVSAGVLRGAADTTFPAAMALIGYWALALPVGWYLAFRAGLGARGLWWGFVVGLMAVAILLLLRIAARFRGPLVRRAPGRLERKGTAMSFKDHFSGHAAVYASFRPAIPRRCSISRSPWPAGARSPGTAPPATARRPWTSPTHFERVIATDASAAQLEHAAPTPRSSTGRPRPRIRGSPPARSTW